MRCDHEQPHEHENDKQRLGCASNLVKIAHITHNFASPGILFFVSM
jgi:hypothetical protein